MGIITRTLIALALVASFSGCKAGKALFPGFEEDPFEATLGLGMIAETTADRAVAVRWYRKVLAADPGNFNALAGLSRLGSAAPPAHGQEKAGTSASNGATS